MLQWLFIFCLAGSSFAARSPSPDLDGERGALEKIQIKFERFSSAAASADAEYERLRTALEDDNRPQARRVAERAALLSRVSARAWRALERFYDEQIDAGLDLHRQTMATELGLDGGVRTYLAFRKNNRFGNGIPIGRLLSAWRGLIYGQKSFSTPSAMRKLGQLEGMTLRTPDSILLLMINGGTIRGRFEGMIDDKLVLREVLPTPLAKIQQRQGHYRLVDLSKVARVEVIRNPPTITPNEAPAPVVTSEGGYTPYYVKSGYAFRVRLRPSDVELLEQIRSRPKSDEEYFPKLREIDLETDAGPAYTQMHFFECESLL